MLKLIVAYCHNITALYSFLCDYFQCYFSFIDLNSLLLLFAARYLLKKNSVVIVLNWSSESISIFLSAQVL